MNLFVKQLVPPYFLAYIRRACPIAFVVLAEYVVDFLLLDADFRLLLANFLLENFDARRPYRVIFRRRVPGILGIRRTLGIKRILGILGI